MDNFFYRQFSTEQYTDIIIFIWIFSFFFRRGRTTAPWISSKSRASTWYWCYKLPDYLSGTIAASRENGNIHERSGLSKGKNIFYFYFLSYSAEFFRTLIVSYFYIYIFFSFVRSFVVIIFFLDSCWICLQYPQRSGYGDGYQNARGRSRVSEFFFSYKNLFIFLVKKIKKIFKTRWDFGVNNSRRIYVYIFFSI